MLYRQGQNRALDSVYSPTILLTSKLFLGSYGLPFRLPLIIWRTIRP